MVVIKNTEINYGGNNNSPVNSHQDLCVMYLRRKDLTLLQQIQHKMLSDFLHKLTVHKFF